MKKIFLVFSAFLLISSVYAQKGINKLTLAADVGIPTGDFSELFKPGPGIMAKLLFGISESDQITATTGITFYGAKTEFIDPDEKLTLRIIPLLGGFRHTFNGGFFLEPQLGFGIYGATYKYLGESESNSDNAFTWAMGMGFSKNSFEAGVRYQSAEKDGSTSMVGIHVGYNFTLGGNK